MHGDVKAHNVMREDGGRVVLMDFGAGQSMRRGVGIEMLAGTPLYLCPERLPAGRHSGDRHLQPGRAALLPGHRALSGRRRTRAEVDEAHRAGGRMPLRDRRPDLPEAFVAVIERAIAPESSARFASAGVFEEALAAAGTSTASWSDVAPKTVVGASAAAWRRSPRLAIGLAAVATLAIGTTVGLWRLAGVGPVPALPVAPQLDFSAGAPRFELSAAFLQVLDTGRRPLAAGARIEPAMALAFELEASRDVDVYIVNEDEQGRSYALFPVANTLQNPLPGGVTHVLPGGPPWEVDSTGGQEHLFVIVSPTPVPDIRRRGRGPAASHRRTTVRQQPRAQHPRHRLAPAGLRDGRGPPLAPPGVAAAARSPAGGRPLDPRGRAQKNP